MLATRTAPHPPLHIVDSSVHEDALADPAAVIEIDSRFLLRGHREVCIRHGSECYRLRHTRNDKLILTK